MKVPENPLIVIAGSIGTGKTSLATVMRDHLGMAVWIERAELNPHLGGLYADPRRWAYEAHEVFLDHAVARLRDAGRAGTAAVVERSPHETVSVFGRMLREMGYIDAAQLAGLRRCLELAEEQIVRPTLMIYLHAPVAELVQRIHARNWQEERVITAEYLSALEVEYARFSRGWSLSPVLDVDTAEVDVREPGNVRRLLASAGLGDGW